MELKELKGIDESINCLLPDRDEHRPCYNIRILSPPARILSIVNDAVEARTSNALKSPQAIAVPLSSPKNHQTNPNPNQKCSKSTSSS
jgi:hypothetical protein